MSIMPQVSQAMQSLLTTTTKAAAATLQFVKRPDRAKLTPSALVQTLVYGWLAHPTATLEQLAQMADRLGVQISAQALDQRFTSATATLLQHVLAASMQHVIAAEPVALPILRRFRSVRVHDSTTIGLPDALTAAYRGCGNDTARGTAGMKCGVQLDLLTGRLCGLERVGARASDHTLAVQRASLPRRSLRLADLGFYDLARFKKLDAVGVYWLSRLQTNSRVRRAGHRSCRSWRCLSPWVMLKNGKGTFGSVKTPASRHACWRGEFLRLWQQRNGGDCGRRPKTNAACRVRQRSP